MKSFKALAVSLILGILLTSSAYCQREVVDKIVAVVGDEVILVSEFANQIQLVALQTGQQPRTESEIAKFQKDILEAIREEIIPKKIAKKQKLQIKILHFLLRESVK